MDIWLPPSQEREPLRAPRYARMVELSERDFLPWAEMHEWDADSRSVERRFRQTVDITSQLRTLLGARA